VRRRTKKVALRQDNPYIGLYDLSRAHKPKDLSSPGHFPMVKICVVARVPGETALGFRVRRPAAGRETSIWGRDKTTVEAINTRGL